MTLRDSRAFPGPQLGLSPWSPDPAARVGFQDARSGSAFPIRLDPSLCSADAGCLGLALLSAGRRGGDEPPRAWVWRRLEGPRECRGRGGAG